MMDDLHLKLHHIQVEILNEIVRMCEKHSLEYCLIGGTLLGAIRHKGFIPWDDDLDIAMPRDSYERFIKLCESELNSKYHLDIYETNPNYWLPFAKIRKKNTAYVENALAKRKDIPHGIWVDIFPLDNAKHQNSFLQFIQAKLVKILRGYISLKQGYTAPTDSLKRFLGFNLLRFFSIKNAFTIQKKLMTLWNNQNTQYFVNLASLYDYRIETIPKSKFFPAVKVEFEGKYYNAPRDWDYILTRVYGDYMQLPPEAKRVNHKPVRIDFGDKDERES
jgi:lipopolysaccharide cholinephosphotransferase